MRLTYHQLNTLRDRLDAKLEGKSRMKHLSIAWVRDRVSVALNKTAFYGGTHEL
jgi:hypothetical protein